METPGCVKVLRTSPELEELRNVWESWPGNRDSEMRSYLEFLRLSPRTERPHVLVVYRGGRPDAILVGRIDLGHISCRLGYLGLNLPAKILCFVYGALRGNASKENCDLIVSSILRSLSDREADAAYMNFLRHDSPLCQLSMQKPGLLSRDYLRATQPHFAATLPTSADEFYKGLSKSVRGNLKEKQKKLIKDFSGNVKIRCFREVGELDGLFHDAEQIAAKSYQRGLGVGFVDNPTTRNQLRQLAERGYLRSYVLYVVGKPCAFMIGDVNEGTYGSNYTGYDEALAKYSPGMYLMAKAIEEFCEDSADRVRGVDLGPGYSFHKQALCNEKWMETAVYIFAPTMRGFCFNVVRSLIGTMDQTIKKALERTNLLQKIKKVWRSRSKPKEPVHVGA
jgi:hypothetical protein